MKLFFRFLIILLVCGSLLSAQTDVESSPEAEPFELLVHFSRTLTSEQAQEFGEQFGITPVEKLAFLPIWRFQASIIIDLDAILALVRHEPGVRSADLNHYRELSSTTEILREQWYLLDQGQEVNGSISSVSHDIRWPEALRQMTNEFPVRVGVIDSGIAAFHPNLSDAIAVNLRELEGVAGVDDDGNGLIDDVNGWDFVAESADMIDRSGHGTHVAGIIGARGDLESEEGMFGVNPTVDIVPIRVFDQWGIGQPKDLISVSNLAEALFYAYLRGARIINLSLGSTSPNAVEYDVLQLLANYGVLIVAAAGNGGNDSLSDNNDITPFYPASYDIEEIISVAAMDRSGWFTNFSNYGLESVDILAPGEDIYSTYVTSVDIFDWDFNTSVDGWTVGKESGNLSPNIWYWEDSLGYLDDGSGPNLYDNNTDLYVQTPYIDATGQVGLKASITYGASLDEWSWPASFSDLFWTEYSTDGLNWAPLAILRDTDGAWRTTTYNLTELENGGYLRFRLETNGIFRADGVALDRVRVHGTDIFASATEPEYIHNNGTSMAAPVVSGVASLLLAERPDLTAQDLKNVLLNTVRPATGAEPYLVSGGHVDADAALAAAKALPPRDIDYWFERHGLGSLPADLSSSVAIDAQSNLVRLVSGFAMGSPRLPTLSAFDVKNDRLHFRFPDGREVAGISQAVEISTDGMKTWQVVASKAFGRRWVASTLPWGSVKVYEEPFFILLEGVEFPFPGISVYCDLPSGESALLIRRVVITE